MHAWKSISYIILKWDENESLTDLWQSKRDKIIKIQTQGYKSTELHMEGCKRSNLQTQKLWMAQVQY